MQKACLVSGISIAIASFNHMFWSVIMVWGAFPFMKFTNAYINIRNIRYSSKPRNNQNFMRERAERTP
jgi:hypothetical protein